MLYLGFTNSYSREIESKLYCVEVDRKACLLNSLTHPSLSWVWYKMENALYVSKISQNLLHTLLIIEKVFLL